jgi:hypothetical protein
VLESFLLFHVQFSSQPSHTLSQPSHALLTLQSSSQPSHALLTLGVQVPWGQLGETWPFFRPNFSNMESYRKALRAKEVRPCLYDPHPGLSGLAEL